MLPAAIINAIESTFLEKGKALHIRDSVSLGGGCINDAHKVLTEEGPYFVKYNRAERYPGMFEAEARGLNLLINQGVIDLPKVVFHGESGGYSYLVLDYIASAQEESGFWQDFGRSLAALHRVSSQGFGLDHDNYIGSLPQSNHRHDDWYRFFIEERLEPQLKLARDTGRMQGPLLRWFDRLFKRLPELIPGEAPSLLHGDLWNGNYMVNSFGKACLIDPAVYYGHRETDLAMTKLFGGFRNEFYTTYNESFPLEQGWEQRMEIHNLYPLMVHVNLFGGGYAVSVEDILRRF